MQSYKIQGFPTVVVIAEGKILYNAGCSSKQQVETIVSLLGGSEK
ncbi:MAG: hypothetical protein NZ481_06460 [Candidatus Kapabacteria bacterium]|nr:hypothetical protein [Candidatus Kapabacteria bacterium]MCX7937699.1 hypothetical protein [Chlorobiota bacterium]